MSNGEALGMLWGVNVGCIIRLGAHIVPTAAAGSTAALADRHTGRREQQQDTKPSARSRIGNSSRAQWI